VAKPAESEGAGRGVFQYVGVEMLTGAAELRVARLLGAHMPTAGGLHKGVLNGHAIGCTAVQLFTTSPRQWSQPPLRPETIRLFREALESTGIAFTVAHDSYLINLAAPSDELLERSRQAFRGELDRAQELGIPWVVTHMGAHLDLSPDEGVARLVESIRRILDETDALNYDAGIALETTAGQGTGLGHTFEQIAQVLEGVGPHPRLGVCLDTCHVFAAGYDLRDEEAYEETLRQFDTVVGIDRLRVIHANDAKKPLGSRVDRHMHIGDGHIGASAFAHLVTDPRLLHVPVIIETPEAEKMHAVNLGKLRRLAAGKPLGVNVHVQMFGHFADVWNGAAEVNVPEGATIRKVAETLAAADAQLGALPEICRCALDEEYADWDTPVTEGCSVAFIPPVSGG
jgi:deoxyribonuclease-4